MRPSMRPCAADSGGEALGRLVRSPWTIFRVLRYHLSPATIAEPAVFDGEFRGAPHMSTRRNRGSTSGGKNTWSSFVMYEREGALSTLRVQTCCILLVWMRRKVYVRGAY